MQNTITKVFHIASAHRIKDHASKCRFLHGHNYMVKMTFLGEINEQGMILDFKLIKEQIINKIKDKLDHKCLLEASDPLVTTLKNEKDVPLCLFEKPPTVEIICQEITTMTRDILKKFEGLSLKSVNMWETKDSGVTVSN